MDEFNKIQRQAGNNYEMPPFLDYSFWTRIVKRLQTKHQDGRIHVSYCAEVSHNVIKFNPQWSSRLEKLLEGTFISIESVFPIIESLKQRKLPDLMDIFPGAEYDGCMEENDFTTLRVALRHKSIAFRKLGVYTSGPWDYLASWPCFIDEDGQNYMDFEGDLLDYE